MNKKIAYLFPGQGAQLPGMGKDFYDAYPIARRTFEEADALLSMAFSDLIFNGSPQQLKETINSQLSIFIVSVAIWRTFQEQFPFLMPAVTAGLSLGEYTALVAAKKLSFQNGLSLVKARAQYMQQACVARKGLMAAVLSLEASVVEEAIKELQKTHSIWVANLNCPLQVVIAGDPEGIEAATKLLKDKGARRIIPLEVSGAFHSGLMQEAQDQLEPHILSAPMQMSDIAIVMNVPGGFVSSLSEMRNNMILQVTHPVRWEQGICAMGQNNIELCIEMGPGKTLAGMNKKIVPSIPTISIEKVSDLALVSQEQLLGETYAAT